MLSKQIKFYKEWLKATGKKHSLLALDLFLKLHKEQLDNLSKFYGK